MFINVLPRGLALACAVALLNLFARSALAASPAGQLGIAPDGKMHLVVNGAELCSLSPQAADKTWKFSSPASLPSTSEDASSFALKVGKTTINGEARLVENDGKAEANWTFVPNTEIALNSLAISTEFPVATLGGGTWEADGKKGTFPLVFGSTAILGADVHALNIRFINGKSITFSFSDPTSVAIQDNRQWGAGSYSLRIGSKGSSFHLAAQEHFAIGMSVDIPGGLSCFRDHPVTITAGDEWVPLADQLDIEPGSALDLSNQGFTDGPCDTHGRIIATPQGHFSYANDPNTPRRFYGVNLCFSSQYLSKEQADLLLDRLVRLGYNAVRIHHYEYALTKPEWKPGFDWDPEKVDRLDYLIAGCAKRGLWITTDLYVSRPVPGKQIGLPGDTFNMATSAALFKILVPAYEPAYNDWQTFARKFLDHVNPYTGRRLAEEPALAWISLINEGPVAGGWSTAKRIPEWTAAWNRWLAIKYPARSDLDLALGNLDDNEDPSLGTVTLPDTINSGLRRSRICQVFLADTERAMCERMRAFLRNELKCTALITDLNCGPNFVPMQAARTSFDYVDDHFYVDHPMFTAGQWGLPSRCSNANPIPEGAPGGSDSASLRIWGKPFTISEFNYSGPGRFRGVGGMLTGALASFQDWDGLWRFAYSHDDKKEFAPGVSDYFNLASDPLNQAADRAAIMLFLRGDLKPSAHRVAVQMPMKTLINPPSKLSSTAAGWLGWTTGIGCAVLDDDAQGPAGSIGIPVQDIGDRNVVETVLKSNKAIDDHVETDGILRSDTGEISIDKSRGVLCIDTPRTAGGYAEPGQSVLAKNSGVMIDELSIGATVFVTSVDKNPIRNSRRLLVTHLTDLQNTGAKYSETARQTLLDWGSLPHLVRDGSAKVHLALAEPGAFTVWALTPGGHRQEKVNATVEAGDLVFTAKVRGADGARILYEVVR